MASDADNEKREILAESEVSSTRRAFNMAMEAIAMLAVPAVLAYCAINGIDQAALLSLVVVLGSIMVFFVGFEGSRPRLRDVMPTVVMAALAAAGRILFAPIPDFKPVSAIAIIAGVTFGSRSGFMVGALAALVSNFFFGQGPWTPWQMYAWGLVGYLAGLLARTPLFKHQMPVYAYGFLSGLLYGFILNLWSIIGFFHPETFVQVLAVYAAAFPLDILHGVATVAFLIALYLPWRRKLVRICAKYGLDSR